MITENDVSPFGTLIAGRLLCHVAAHDGTDVALTDRVALVTRAHGASGLVVRGKCSIEVIRRQRSMAPRQPLIVDSMAWSQRVATADIPLDLPPPGDGGMFPISLDEWARGILRQGADGVMTPSAFVADGDWPALKAVLAASAEATDPRVCTLVATDAAMLAAGRLQRFVELVAEQRGGRPLAFAFAAREAPLASVDRIAGLRMLLRAFPGSLVLAAEALAGTDVLACDGAAAIGLTSSLRRPSRPFDGGGPAAKGWIPGMFLRELWETRSPAVYEDWYRNRRAPTCIACGGRAADSFTDHPADKHAVLLHNVHAWLDVLTEMCARDGGSRRSWLAADRLRGLEAHIDLPAARSSVEADKLLRALCELDDPEGRRTTATGAWR